ncbi:hypothetical protein LIPSTDRAFT_235811 [Lipomyces starkeyi NRRL Y-11557]|uniref:Uncharacterized protein n=1 Tax=Lipomyces starkeyi NRRL Y-11557 TaxID=675824 RepID=A0A1E3QBC5_LIPST|nr:hypothetical protein LIPSTDRAFT_235811 [Lipomyces starkeyi NRRL Y-11557]
MLLQKGQAVLGGAPTKTSWEVRASRFYQVMSPGDMATTNQVLFSKSGYYGDFPKLKGEDLLHLRAFQLAEALEYTMDISELPEEKLKKNSNALSCLLINMESTYQKIHITAIKARDVWRALEEQFALIWAASKPRLMCNLYSTKMKDDMTLEAHFQQLSHIRDQLVVAGQTIDEPSSSKYSFGLSHHFIAMHFPRFSPHRICR